jgi:hypothetical protein
MSNLESVEYIGRDQNTYHCSEFLKKRCINNNDVYTASINIMFDEN